MKSEKFAAAVSFLTTLHYGSSKFFTFHSSLFTFSVRHFTDELDAHESDFVFVSTQFLNSGLQVVGV